MDAQQPSLADCLQAAATAASAAAAAEAAAAAAGLAATKAAPAAAAAAPEATAATAMKAAAAPAAAAPASPYGDLRGESGETLRIATINIRSWRNSSHQIDVDDLAYKTGSPDVLVLTETKRAPTGPELRKHYMIHHSGCQQSAAGVAVLVGRGWARAGAVHGVQVPPACAGYVAHVRLRDAAARRAVPVLGVYIPGDPGRPEGREAAYAYLSHVLAGVHADHRRDRSGDRYALQPARHRAG